MQPSYKLKDNRGIFAVGCKDGIPIGLGYLAVSFSLGIAAKGAGLDVIQAFVASMLCKASAGQYAGFTLIAVGAPLFEVALTTLITNARYLLMSCALAQRVDPNMPFYHRFFIANDITDELFGISIAREGYINPYYNYGAALVAVLCWSFGTAFGVLAGSVLPLGVVSAFSVALYGMFIAVFIPPCKGNMVMTGLIIICFVSSWLFATLPVFSFLSEGMRTILLTVIIASGAAVLFPKKEEQHE